MGHGVGRGETGENKKILFLFTCARRFGNSDLSAAGHLGNGEAKVLEVRHFMPISVVSPCHLSRDKISFLDPDSASGEGIGLFGEHIQE